MASEEFRSSLEVRTGFVQGNTFGYRPVQYYAIDGQAIFEGDIVLDSVDGMERLVAEVINETGVAAGVVITGAQFRWPGGIVPFTIDPALPDVARVNDAILHWHERTSIRLIPLTNEQNFVTFRPGGGCSSQVGMRGGQQFITLAPGCDRGSTIHEIGHAVGIWHEQSREDRDRFIRILWQNITPGMEHNFAQHIADGDDVGPYDFGSIMHYPTWAFSRNNQPTVETLNSEAIGQRNVLSDGDVQAINFMYPTGLKWSWANQGKPAGVTISGPVGVLTMMDTPTSAQRPYAFVQGSDGNLWVNWWNGSVWSWANQGNPPGVAMVSGPVGVLTVKDTPTSAERPYAFVQGSDGNLWVNWWG